jgi:cytochrome oxidase Cu insertion factor (SCO1/SenC/PrrC family)
MKGKHAPVIIGILALIIGLALGFGAATMFSEGKNARLNVGDQAPEFELYDSTGRLIALSDFRGKNVVLAFYPAAWTPV